MKVKPTVMNTPEPTIAEEQPQEESFASLFEEYLKIEDPKPGVVVNGTVIEVSGGNVLIDAGLKAEGWVSINEFVVGDADKPEVKAGDKCEIYIERLQNKDGLAVLSREKARRELAWGDLEKKFEAGTRVEGYILYRVKGGYNVNVEGAIAFLPGSQIDIRPTRDISPLLKTSQPFQILKMDRQRGNIVVSRRAVMEDAREEERNKLLQVIQEGMIMEGVVKNITNYGVFVDLGGIDGLVHITDMTWKRVYHPSDILSLGDTVKVQVIRFSPENQRISLGMKQLEADPWQDLEVRYPKGVTFDAVVTNLADYGAFVELEQGVEGLVHVSEMMWSKRNLVVSKFLATGDKVQVQILDIDIAKRRISLGMKQCTPNPWEEFLVEHPIGTEVTGKIKTITEFGLFIGLTDEIDGMAHVSYLGNDKNGNDKILASYNKGDEVTMEVIEINPEKERISLGLKNRKSHSEGESSYKIGDITTCLIQDVSEKGLDVIVGGDVEGHIPRGELAVDPSERRLERFAVGEKIDAQIMRINRSSGKLTLSVRKHEKEEERAAVKAYGSTDSGASLGDILGVELDSLRQQTQEAQNEQQENHAPTAENTDEEKADKKSSKSEEVEEKPTS